MSLTILLKNCTLLMMIHKKFFLKNQNVHSSFFLWLKAPQWHENDFVPKQRPTCAQHRRLHCSNEMMKTVNKANLWVVIIKTSTHIPKHHSSSLLLRPIVVHYYSTIFIRVDYLKWRCITVKQGETERKISSPRKK